MRPLTIFESHFRATEVLIKVYRLLDPEGARDGVSPKTLSELRRLMEYEPAEPLMVLLNDLFFGIVRERAQIHPEFFQRANLSLLLRQAVVSACTAMDVFFPALLEAHLPGVVEVRQRNFLPAGQRRTLGFFVDRKFNQPSVVEKLVEFGFKPGNYRKIVVSWGWDSDVPAQAAALGVDLWDFRDILQDISHRSAAKSSYFTDDTMRTLQLMAKATRKAP